MLNMEGEHDGTDPDLPTLPPPSTLPTKLGKISPSFPRKSSHDLDFSGTSSDPPIFSSDDVPEGSENYMSRRKKMSRIGPWWESSQPLQPRKKRRTEKITRNLDSGVFMGVTTSNASPAISSDFPSSEADLADSDSIQDPPVFSRSQPVPVARELTLSQEMMPPPVIDNYTRWGPPKDLISSFYCPDEDQENNAKPGNDAVDLASSRTLGRRKRGEEALLDAAPVKDTNACRHLRLRLSWSPSSVYKNHSARLIVDKAVETGCEDIDLSGQLVWHDKETAVGTDRPDDRIFHPLHHLVKTRAVYDPDRYDSLIPDMRLWLSDNKIETLPTEVYRLRNLTQLGLRQNKIQTLSPSVSQLVRLQSLNLSGNPIAYLPWEITRLQNLTTLLVDIAHTYRPITEGITSKPLSHDRTHEDRWIVEMVSSVSWLDKTGIPILHSASRPSTTPSFDPSSRTSPLRKPPTDKHESQARSLFDLCVRTICSVPEAEAFLHGPCAHLLPSHHAAILKSAHQTERTGGTLCSVCDRPFIIPRAEWIEWASHGRQTRRVPLVRTTCSWNCARQHFDNYRVDSGPSRRTRSVKPVYLHDVVLDCGWR